MFDKTRDDIKDFAKAMEKVMVSDHNLDGDYWKYTEISFLESCLEEEFRKWKLDKATIIGKQKVIDIANICMALFHRYSTCND